MVDKKELQEARAAGQQVLRLLDQVEGTLRKARNWGFFDLVSKRSLFSSLIKFGKINKAEVSCVKYRLPWSASKRNWGISVYLCATP